MMSLAMLACRTGSPASLIPETYGTSVFPSSRSLGTHVVLRFLTVHLGPKRIHIPKAPPLGLLLQSPQFKTYNQRLPERRGGGGEERDPIDWDLYKDQMETFKVKFIYDKLRLDELETHVYVTFSPFVPDET